MKSRIPSLSGTEAAGVYRRLALNAVPRLLGTMDRTPLSPTAGSLDRDHWAWKFRDSPAMGMQLGMIPLAMLWREEWPGNPWRHQPRLLEWLRLSIRETVRRQGRHGGFETIGPNTFDHGMTLAMCHALAVTIESLGDALDHDSRNAALGAIHRGTRFALRTREDYAFISNHQALCALSYYRCGRLLEDQALREAGDRCVRDIIAHQSPDGWYLEYGGPDPGYETLGLHYLASCWLETGNADLLASMKRSVAFLAHCVHPDGSLGGVYGSRQCEVYHPGGLETVAPHVPLAAALCAFLAGRLDRSPVVTPAAVDAQNIATVLMSYLAAARACEARPDTGSPPQIPCESFLGTRRFEHSGVVVAGTDSYYAVTNLSKGGVLRLFDKSTSELVCEDAGYVADEADARWCSQSLGTFGRGESPGPYSAQGPFALARQEQLTPRRLVLLRLLNLTVFRSLTLGALVRRIVIGRLITGRRTTNRLTLDRSIRFEPDRVGIVDELRASEPSRLAAIWRPRAFNPVHMGSASYFVANQSTGIADLSPPALLGALRRAGGATVTTMVTFGRDVTATEVTATERPLP